MNINILRASTGLCCCAAVRTTSHRSSDELHCCVTGVGNKSQAYGRATEPHHSHEEPKLGEIEGCDAQRRV